MLKFGDSIDAYKNYDIKKKIVTLLVDGNFRDAMAQAISIFETDPNYCTLVNYFEPNPEHLIRNLKDSKEIDRVLLFYLIKEHRISKMDTEYLLDRLVGIDFLTKAIRIKAKLSTKKLSSADLESLLLDIDDFSIYQYALDNNIELRFSNTANFKWYSIIRSRDIAISNDFIVNLTNFTEIHKLIKLTDMNHHSDRTYDILIKYLRNELVGDMTPQCIELYEKEKSLLSLKLLLALLISSKKQSNILLAMYITYKYDRSESYEPSIVHMFCNRYFLLLKNIRDLFYSMEIKTIQRYNMAYVWIDPSICSGRFHIVHDLQFSHSSDIELLTENVFDFVESNKIAFAGSTIKTICGLKNNVAVKEFYERKFVSTESNTMFSDLLGESCAFFFNKITKEHYLSNAGCISTIFEKPTTVSLDALFENDYSIRVSEEFIGYFIEAYSDIK